LESRCNRRDAEDAEKNAEEKHTNMVFSSDLGALGASAVAFRIRMRVFASPWERWRSDAPQDEHADTPRGGVIILRHEIA